MTRCDIYSIGLILHCMPNLRQFVFTLIVDIHFPRLIIDLSYGHNWRQMLIGHVSNLEKFDFHISLIKFGHPLPLDDIFKSFKCLVDLYHQWDMCISRWNYWPNIPFWKGNNS